MSLDAALEMIRRRRPTAQPIQAFLELLKSIGDENDQDQDIAGKEIEAKVGLVGPQKPPVAASERLAEAETSQPIDKKKKPEALDAIAPKRRRMIGPSRGP